MRRAHIVVAVIPAFIFKAKLPYPLFRDKELRVEFKAGLYS
jgi:hypothetical protein